MDGAAARKADLEGLVVRDPVLDESGRPACEDGLRLLVDRRLDAAPGDRPGDLASLGHGEDRARIARCRSSGRDDGRGGGPETLGDPALESVENVLHVLFTPVK